MRGSHATSRACSPAIPGASSRTCGPSLQPWWRMEEWFLPTLWVSKCTTLLFFPLNLIPGFRFHLLYCHHCSIIHQWYMVNWLHLYSAFIQSTFCNLPLVRPSTHRLTHRRQQSADLPIRSNFRFSLLSKDMTCRREELVVEQRNQPTLPPEQWLLIRPV